MARLDWSEPTRSFLKQLQDRNITLDAVDDGEGCEPCLNSSNSALAIRQKAAEDLTAADSSWLQISHGDQKAVLFFVFEGMPEEILCDWQVKSNSPLDALIEDALNDFSRIWDGRPCPTLPETE